MTCTNPWPLWRDELFLYLEQHDPFFPCNLSFDCSKTSLQVLTPSHHFFSFSRHNCYWQNTARRKPTSGANSDSEAEESSNSSHENQLNYRSPPSSYMCYKAYQFRPPKHAGKSGEGGGSFSVIPVLNGPSTFGFRINLTTFIPKNKDIIHIVSLFTTKKSQLYTNLRSSY